MRLPFSQQQFLDVLVARGWRLEDRQAQATVVTTEVTAALFRCAKRE